MTSSRRWPGPLWAIWEVVDGVGDLFSSLAAGLLRTTWGARWGFGSAVVVSLAGALWMGGVSAVKR